jgi:breast cancer 2 susceptibility protein
LPFYCRSSICDISPCNSEDFQFIDNDGSFKGAFQAFESLLNQNLKSATLKWVKNHYRWIVWTLSSIASRIEGCLHLWNWQEVLNQLAFRYDQEINLTKVSCLKAIIEQNDTSLRHMVLCISKINEAGDYGELTDGWYKIGCQFDTPLSYFAKTQNIFVGMKLHLQGAQLCGAADPLPVLEAPATIFLKLFSNSTRVAKGFAPLGYQDTPFFPICLDGVILSGSSINCISVVVCSRYPLLYTETRDGIKTTHTQNEEHLKQSKWVEKYENAYNFAKDQNERRGGFFEKHDIDCEDINESCREYADVILKFDLDESSSP